MASRIAPRYLATILRTPQTVSPSFLRPYPHLPRTLQPSAHRSVHTIPKPTIPAQDGAPSSSSSSSSSSPSSADATTPRKQLEPHYQLTFTCVPCAARSTHVVSKQGYHRGSVLISCPSCRNRHIISDNLNIFGDRKITVEDLLRERGQLVKRGTLGEDGDIEFWDDDAPGAGEADAAPSQGEGGKDKARRLRETRDPSSQATRPTPSTSVLPGNMGTRPSVQSASHQSTTPSTRRQFVTRRVAVPPGPILRKSKRIGRVVGVTPESDGPGANPSDPGIDSLGEPHQVISPGAMTDLAHIMFDYDRKTIRRVLAQEGQYTSLPETSNPADGSCEPRTKAPFRKEKGQWKTKQKNQSKTKQKNQSKTKQKNQSKAKQKNQSKTKHKNQPKTKHEKPRPPKLWALKMRMKEMKEIEKMKKKGEI
ncbi:DNL zinc finger-domain-containing protein [Xylaria sp. FL1042]|nr:DNL zinc finger-domain-containing protein [Xylaria sp. FL1042]